MSIRLLTILFAIITVPVWAQLTCTVNGYFPKSWEGKQAMLVVSPLNQKQLIDTTTIHNRGATFTATVTEPCPAYVWVEGNKEDIELFLDSPNIQIAYDPGTSEQALISGSPETELWQEQKSQFAEFAETSMEMRTQAYDAFRAGDSLTGLHYMKIVDSVRAVIKKTLVQQIDNNPTSNLSWYRFTNNYTEFSYKQALKLFYRLSAFSNYPSYKTIEQLLLRRQPGKKAPDFNLIGLTNDTVTLSRLTSKLILIDFASLTLATCQERHAALRKLYETYHPLGLDIITICFEPDQQSLQANSTRERLPWRQVFSLINSSDPVMEAFAVERMPDNVLLDSDKTVLERDLSVSELEEKLKQLLDKR